MTYETPEDLLKLYRNDPMLYNFVQHCVQDILHRHPGYNVSASDWKGEGQYLDGKKFDEWEGYR